MWIHGCQIRRVLLYLGTGFVLYLSEIQGIRSKFKLWSVRWWVCYQSKIWCLMFSIGLQASGACMHTVEVL